MRSILFFLWRAATGRHAFAHISDTRANYLLFAVLCVLAMLLSTIVLPGAGTLIFAVCACVFLLVTHLLPGPFRIAAFAAATSIFFVAVLLEIAGYGVLALPYCVWLLWKLAIDYFRLPFDMRRTGYRAT